MEERKRAVTKDAGILNNVTAREIFQQIMEAPQGISAYQIKKTGVHLPSGKSRISYPTVHYWIDKLKTHGMIYRTGVEQNEKNHEKFLYSPTEIGTEAYKYSMDPERAEKIKENYLQEFMNLNQRALSEIPGLKEKDLFLAALKLVKNKEKT